MTSAPANTGSLLTARDISISFDGRPVLQHVDLEVNRGRIVTLIGPNGAGKTTLVRIVLGLLHPDSGHIDHAPGLTIGYMPQKLAIDPTLPITVDRFLRLTGSRVEQPAQKIDSLLAELRVSHLRNHPLNAVSGGELQRILLARALLREPRLLVLDEPAQGVDVTGQAELYQLISNISEQQGCGILMISHDLHLVMSSTDEVVCLNQHICCQGKPDQVSNDPAYLDLFGDKAAKSIAVYTHNHNHHHDIKGNIIEQDNG
ncbi:MAG: zinc ABC transporter ATP-binding protein ZnuC [Pseudohongiellaceae bacterium]